MTYQLNTYSPDDNLLTLNGVEIKSLSYQRNVPCYGTKDDKVYFRITDINEVEKFREILSSCKEEPVLAMKYRMTANNVSVETVISHRIDNIVVDIEIGDFIPTYVFEGVIQHGTIDSKIV